MKEKTNQLFIKTASYANFIELAQVCREEQIIAACFGKPGVGKTFSAKMFSDWLLVDANMGVKNGVLIEPERLKLCDTIYYLPSVTVSAARIKTELGVLRNKFEAVIKSAVSWSRPDNLEEALQKKRTKLIIVDEAYRLKFQALEELRDLIDKWEVGLVLVGDPGFERTLGRLWHFATRVAYVEELKALTESEVNMYIDKRLKLLELSKPSDDVCKLIFVITQGNLRALGHLFAIIERLLRINDDIVSGITKEVVETAKGMMLFGLNGTLSKDV
jgi:DNA transposition AAA+ family ATPase